MYLLCTVWCNNTDFCPICKISHMLTRWCQFRLPCNSQDTLYGVTWECLTKSQIWKCCVLYDFKFGENKPCPHPCFPNKTASQAHFTKVFNFLLTLNVLEDIFEKINSFEHTKSTRVLQDYATESKVIFLTNKQTHTPK